MKFVLGLLLGGGRLAGTAALSSSKPQAKRAVKPAVPGTFDDLEETGELPADFFDDVDNAFVPEEDVIVPKTGAQREALDAMLSRKIRGEGPEPPQWEANREKARARSKKASQDVVGDKRRQMLDVQRGFRAKERAPAPAKLAKAADAALAKLSVGDWFDGVVRSTRPFGAWVTIGAEVDGFVHVKDISATDFVSDAATALKKGDAVRVCVKQASVFPPKLSLSLIPVAPESDAPPRPVGDYAVGERLEGALVQRMTPFAAFVDCGCEVQAYLHVVDIGLLPQMRIGAPREPRLRPEPGVVIEECWVKDIDVVRNRLRISLVPPEEQREREARPFNDVFDAAPVDEDEFFRGDVL
ncbi:hypothetical protein M885DRAFT_616782 [Pelagophyceae sp. CCMP2097]|nr:hypothetical protein M885DRAFT_616782 [Pelagophyceae sp. CCMP2097]